MDELVFVNDALISSKPFTTSEIIAKQMHLKESTVIHRINQYRDRLEHFGKIEFKSIIERNSGAGRPKKFAQLNEQQATLLITFFKNTKVVADFKENLVRQFYDMRQEIIKRRIYKEIDKPVRRTLTDTISKWQYFNKWSYKAITDLICKAITGKTTKILKLDRGCGTDVVGTDIYTSKEMAMYHVLESKVIKMLNNGNTYEQIKLELLKKNVQPEKCKKNRHY
ncbi:Rha family transcriptional regulator [Companilactobacillus nantensis]|uniref:Phage protein n=1 Tax=Companilactobacillus nantensis DSM 16982 TaxID=1423774 RepID=A0A0R1WCN1_9LACO|nr:Rha family transcriptional regulator [Companilactobacillus nantensis]KRM15389.1 phage protein [Companilactobacillus nantensis DSM 16982]GEO65051.1 hypothetical protein LNA01_22340 [Companilactobacillus nantensis]